MMIRFGIELNHIVDYGPENRLIVVNENQRMCHFLLLMKLVKD